MRNVTLSSVSRKQDAIFYKLGGDYISLIGKRLFILGVIFFTIMSLSGIYALENGSDVEKRYDARKVSILLQEYTINSDGNEIQYGSNKRNVVPSEHVSLIPKIFNNGIDCYVRAEIRLQDSFNNEINLSNYLKGMSEKWEKQGVYYYYKPVLNAGETVEIFNVLQIPTELTNKYGNRELTLSIVAEAVQAKNFNPDYSLDDPWHGVAIEQRAEDTYTVGDETKDIFIKYRNNAKKSIIVQESFLDKIAALLPGDKTEEKVKIKNISNDRANYTLDITKEEKLTKEEEEILKGIKLKITNSKGLTVFSGNLLDVERILLGEYGAGEEDELTFEFDVSMDPNTVLEKVKSKLRWIFQASYDESKLKTKETGNPKTGDNQFDVSLMIFFISAICLIITIILSYIEKRKCTEKNK